VNKFLNFGKALWQDESGATAIEYGLLAALIAVVIIGTVVSLGKQLDATFEKVDTDLKANTPLTAPVTPAS
jgi:pilus assembly protein Flp/PilA